MLLVHGWDRIKKLHFYSLLALSTHKHVKGYLTMTKIMVIGHDLLWALALAAVCCGSLRRRVRQVLRIRFRV